MDLLDIAMLVLEGEILVQSDNIDAGMKLFEKAIVIEDGLNYNEPPDWFFSVRHHLGNALLTKGNWARAEEIYREDLFVFPDNGWALSGLQKALKMQGKDAEAAEIDAKMDASWSRADVKLDGSKVMVP